MKRLIVKIMLPLLALTLGQTAVAQTDSLAARMARDTMSIDESAIAVDSLDLDESGIAVDSLDFDESGIAIEDVDYDQFVEPDSMRAGKRNPIYYFGHDFSTIFVEVSTLLGSRDRAIGLSVAYVPEVWGGYIMGHDGIHYRWLSGGAEYRLSSPWDRVDWHCYGGVAIGRGVGGEVGLRVATNAEVNHGKFATISGSVGLRAMSGGIFVTGGLSVALAAGATLLWLLL
ncbi:MAG: hypothetical protein IJ620_00130 [Bacteroidales bacterium]|nr:hypothetical protein [Bacteroidales bacterium]